MPDPFDPAQAHCERLFDSLGLESVRPPNPERLPEPQRSQTGHAAIEWARSGAMSLTGSPKGPPEFADGALASAARGAARALAALAPDSGLDALDGPSLLGERAALSGLRRRGNISAGGSARLLKTTTGTLALNLPRKADWRLVPAWLESQGPTDSSEKAWAFVSRQVALLDQNRLVQRGQMMGLAVAPALPRAINVDPLFTLTHASEAKAKHRRSERIRLLDLTSLWAGPLATSLLAMTGIEVLKIESPNRPDGARRGPKAFFDLLNGNKQGCALDLSREHDRSLFEQLLDSADIVVESARPRGLRQLGFDAESWVEQRSGRIWASITGYGRASDAIAFGDDAAIAAGLGWRIEESHSEPRFCADAIADPLTGLHSAFFILAHLARGHGGLLDLSLTNIAAHAAQIEHDGLTLPVEIGSNHSCVVDGERRVEIQLPRARSIPWTAPLLQPMTEGRLLRWTTPC